MIKTIRYGNHHTIQGEYVKELPDGRIVVRLDGQDYVGKEVK